MDKLQAIDPTVVAVVLMLLNIVLGVLMKGIYEGMRDLRVQDGQLHERINTFANTFVRRDDYMAFGRDIKDALARIESKLDGKADKHYGAGQ